MMKGKNYTDKSCGEKPRLHFDNGALETQKDAKSLRSQTSDFMIGYEEALKRRTIRWLVPLLQKHLDIKPGSKILNIGCGVGWDIDYLNHLGYECYGIDLGIATKAWERRNYKNRLVKADALHLPFKNDCFDLVMSFDVIEHIGTLPPFDRTLREDFQLERIRFAEQLFGVLKTGRCILLTTPNKSFPIDAGHYKYNIFGARLHSPFEKFLLDIYQIKKLFKSAEITFLPLTGYFEFKRSKKVFWKRMLVKPTKLLIKFLDSFPKLKVSPLCPQLCVCIKVGDYEKENA